MGYDYLLILQNFRQSLPDWVNLVIAGISESGPVLAIVLPLILFWCVDKGAGIVSSFSFATGCIFKQVIKNIACVNRPWIINSSIIPYEKTLPLASGYSFPSGHTTATTSSFMGIALRSVNKVIYVLCLIYILLVGYSRNHLGFHTPADVYTGLFIGLFSAVIINSLFIKYSGSSKFPVVILILGFLIPLLVILIFEFKSYPLEYNQDGSLLVDPELMKLDCYNDAGIFAGIFISYFIDSKFIKYEIKGTVWQKIIRVFAGFLFIAIIYLMMNKFLAPAIGAKAWHFVRTFVCFLCGFCAVPFGVKKIRKIIYKEN